MNTKMKKEDLFLLDELEKASDQYPRYVISLQANLFASHGVGDVIPNLKDLISKDVKKTMGLLDDMERLVKNLKDGEIKLESKEWAKKTKEDYQTAFVSYVAKQFLQSHLDVPLFSVSFYFRVSLGLLFRVSFYFRMGRGYCCVFLFTFPSLCTSLFVSPTFSSNSSEIICTFAKS